MDPISNSTYRPTAGETLEQPGNTQAPTSAASNSGALRESLDTMNLSGREGLPLRLQNLTDRGLLHKDLESPVTPNDEAAKSVLSQYSDPSSLPDPVYQGDHAAFGAVNVPTDKVQDYQAVRSHMVEGGARGQKYLAALEHPKDGQITEVYPHSGNDTIPNLKKGALDLKARTEAGWKTYEDGDTRNMVRFNTENAWMGTNGAVISPATAAAHEIGHAVRRGWNNDGPMPAGYSHWTSPEEHHVITKLERDVATAHAEKLRDSHTIVGSFKAKSITSTVPANPEDAKVVEKMSAKLQRSTESQDKAGLVNGDDHEYGLRSEPIRAARSTLKALENGSLAGTSTSSERRPLPPTPSAAPRPLPPTPSAPPPPAGGTSTAGDPPALPGRQ